MNKVFLIGNLTRDPELRTTPNGFTVCNFGLAVNRRRKVEGQPDVDFFNITAWRQLGETAAKYLSKGRKVCVVGWVQMRSYDGSDGTKRYSLDVEADDIEFLPNASMDGEPRSSGSYGGQQSQTPPAPPSFAPAESGFTEVDEDELPF